jgi:hypothetical protein
MKIKLVSQGVGNAESNVAIATQTGDKNFWAKQSYDNNLATVVQVGDKISVSRPKFRSWSISWKYCIHQSGDDNYGKQDQMGSLNDALIDQFEMITRQTDRTKKRTGN